MLPEIAESVSTFLTATDLLVCVQVSSSWHQLFTPLLWQTLHDRQIRWSNPDLPAVDMDSSGTATEGQERNQSISATLVKNAHHILHLTLTRFITVKALLQDQCCTHLQSLEVDFGYHFDNYGCYPSSTVHETKSSSGIVHEFDLTVPEDIFEPAIPATTDNPDVAADEEEDGDYEDDEEVGSERVPLRTKARQSQLQAIDRTRHLWQLILNNHANLQHLHLRNQTFASSRPVVWSTGTLAPIRSRTFLQASLKKLTRLRSLSMMGLEQQDLELWPTLFPHLEMLHLMRKIGHPVESFVKLLSVAQCHPPYAVHHSQDSKGGETVQWIQCLSRVRNLELADMDDLHELEAVLKLFPQLKFLAINVFNSEAGPSSPTITATADAESDAPSILAPATSRRLEICHGRLRRLHIMGLYPLYQPITATVSGPLSGPTYNGVNDISRTFPPLFQMDQLQELRVHYMSGFKELLWTLKTLPGLQTLWVQLLGMDPVSVMDLVINKSVEGTFTPHRQDSFPNMVSLVIRDGVFNGVKNPWLIQFLEAMPGLKEVTVGN